MFWLIIAAAGAVVATVLPTSREKVKDVPWMPLAVAVGLVALGGGIHDGLRKVGADSVKQLRLSTDTVQNRGYSHTNYKGGYNYRGGNWSRH